MLSAPLLWAALRIAFAIVLDTAALIIWDIGTRSPARVVADLRSGARNRVSIARGSLRFLTGALALVAAASLTAPIVRAPWDATIIECWALVTALVLEGLVGPDLRARRRGKLDAR